MTSGLMYIGVPVRLLFSPGGNSGVSEEVEEVDEEATENIFVRV
jgi:hypothetical protein